MTKVRLSLRLHAQTPTLSLCTVGIIQTANPKVAQIFGYKSAEELIKTNVRHLVGDRMHREAHDSYLADYCRYMCLTCHSSVSV